MALSKKIKRKIGAAVYYLVAKHLPPSWSGLHIGQTALRRLCGKLMLENCGKNVNIESGAAFSSKVTLGDYSGIGINAKIYGTCHRGRYVMMVTTDVPPYSIVAGVPARKIRDRFEREQQYK